MQNTSTQSTNGNKVRFQPVAEPVMPKVPLNKKLSDMNWLLLGLNDDGTIAQNIDELTGGKTPEVEKGNTKWYLVHDRAPLMLKNSAISKVWIGLWSDKHGRYLFNGEALAEAIAIASHVAGAVSVRSHPELVALAKSVNDVAKKTKERKEPVTAEFNTLFNQLFAAARAAGATREQLAIMVRNAAPELAAQPTRQ